MTRIIPLIIILGIILYLGYLIAIYISFIMQQRIRKENIRQAMLNEESLYLIVDKHSGFTDVVCKKDLDEILSHLKSYDISVKELPPD